MSVYFVQALYGGPIKIGYCTEGREQKRLDQYRTHNPCEVHFTRVIAGAGRDVERALHARFRDLRMRGEWYWPAPELAVLAEAVPDTDLERDVLAAAEGILAEADGG